MLITKKPIGTIGIMGGLMTAPTEFAVCLAKCIQYNMEFFAQPGEYIHLEAASSSYHVTARNGLSKTFLGDWLLMLDVDHAFEPDIAVRMVTLMYQEGIDVLSAIYRYKAHPFLPTVYCWTGDAFQIVGEMQWNAPLVKIDCAGAGCLLVRRRVFDRIRDELHEEPFDILGKFSEDFSFFHRLMWLGIPAYVSPQIYSTHLRVTGVTNDMYDPTGLVLCPFPTGGAAALTRP